MKSITVIAVVIAASQCTSEPSGGPEQSDAASQPPAPRKDAGSPDAGADAATSADAGAAEQGTVSDLITPGPAPFTVPTTQVRALEFELVAPQGTRVSERGDHANVVLGEGANFAMRVEPSGRAEPATEQVAADDDGLRVWNAADAWFFTLRTDTLVCSNPLDAAHDREDVDMMIASCRSAKTAAP